MDIKPFSVGLNPLVIYDIESEKIYRDIKIDSDEAAIALASSAGRALGFAQKIIYYCKETIGYLLAKGNSEREALDKFGSDRDESKDEEKKNIGRGSKRGSEKSIKDN